MAVSQRNKLQVDVGSVVGTLRLLSTEVNGAGRRHWQCECLECGMVRPIRNDHLARYVGTACHCKPHTMHGFSMIREFRIWTKMIDRCHNPNAHNYRFYGGIGRYVCQGWRDSFEAFYADLGSAPSMDHTLDRKDTLGSYTCGECKECRERNATANCQWATKHFQSRNAKDNRYYTHDGKTLILKDWARLVGIKYVTLFTRLDRGWSFVDAISTPTLPSRAGRPNRK